MIKIEVANLDEICDEFAKRIINSAKACMLHKELPSIDHAELHGEIISFYNIKPDELMDVNRRVDKCKKFEKFLKTKKYNIKTVERIFFDYDSLIKKVSKNIKHGYWLAKELNIRVCPYCNRQYTFTVSRDKKSTRHQLDHFLCKKRYPCFALSFYNLIPSCATCNLLKSTKTISINPYREDFGDCKFEISDSVNFILGETTDFKIILKDREGKFPDNASVFLLHELYNEHKDHAKEIVFKAFSYNEGYYTSLIESFSELGLSEPEMELIIFGNYISKEDYGKRPLAKLTADILKQIKG